MTASAPANGARPASSLLVVLTSIATILFTSAAGYVTTVWQADRAAAHAERVTEIDRFLKSTESLEPLVRAHMGNVLHDRPQEKSREDLIKNLQEQHVILDDVRTYVPSEMRGLSDDYADTLAKTAIAAQNATSVLTAGPLMEQANNIVVQKRRLAAALRKGAGLAL